MITLNLDVTVAAPCSVGDCDEIIQSKAKFGAPSDVDCESITSESLDSDSNYDMSDPDPDYNVTDSDSEYTRVIWITIHKLMIRATQTRTLNF